jgi:lincosamide nucleotidyltransferase A/C/D/E
MALLLISAADAAGLLTLFAERGIQVWLDGGWAVDAVLGRQTRPHEDIDIALHHDDVPALRQLFTAVPTLNHGPIGAGPPVGR